MPSAFSWGSYSYRDAGYGMPMKLVLLVIGLGGILAMLLLPNRKIPVASYVGANTMPVYCLHGFLLRLLRANQFFAYSEKVNLALALGVSLAALVLLSGPPVTKTFTAVFTLSPVLDKTRKTVVK